MFSLMLLAISIIALSQFALYYWRAVLAGVAAQPVSDRVLVAAQVENGRLTPQHFHITGLSKASMLSSARGFPLSPSGASANA